MSRKKITPRCTFVINLYVFFFSVFLGSLTAVKLIPRKGPVTMVSRLHINSCITLQLDAGAYQVFLCYILKRYMSRELRSCITIRYNNTVYGPFRV